MMTKDISPPTRSNLGLALMLLAVLFWGTIGVATKALYELVPTNPASVGLLRLVIALPVLLLGYWATAEQMTFRARRADLAAMLLFGLAMALFQVCYLGAIARIGVTVATIISVCLPPVLVAFVSVRVLHETLTRQIWLVLGCTLGGTTLLILGQPVGQISSQSDGMMGVALAVGSALCMAFGTLTLQRLSGRYHPLQPLIVGFGVGAVILFPFALATELVITYPPLGWALLIYLGLFPTALAYVLFLVGMHSSTATIASIATMFETLTSAMLAWLLFGERLSVIQAIGAVLVLMTLPLLSARKAATPVQVPNSQSQGALQ